VKKIIYILPLLLLTLLGCGTKITEEDLIGGTWVATAGYQNGEPKGDPYCLDFVMEGLEFKGEDIVYSVYHNEEYTYHLEEKEADTVIVINRKGTDYHYFIDKINDDEIGLIGDNHYEEEESCYLERK